LWKPHKTAFRREPYPITVRFVWQGLLPSPSTKTLVHYWVGLLSQYGENCQEKKQNVMQDCKRNAFVHRPITDFPGLSHVLSHIKEPYGAFQVQKPYSQFQAGGPSRGSMRGQLSAWVRTLEDLGLGYQVIENEAHAEVRCYNSARLIKAASNFQQFEMTQREPRRKQRWRSDAKYLLLLCIIGSLGTAFAQNPPSDFDEVSSQATAAREQNDIPRAVELYRQAVQLNPQWSDGWWFLGLLQYGQGLYPTAAEALSHYLELAPDAAPALALRGLCEFNTGDYAPALADIAKGISLGAANDARNEQILRYHESLLLTVLGKFQTALDSYSYFAKNNIASPELMLAIGLAGLQMPLLPDNVKADQKELVANAGKAAFEYMSGDEAGAKQAFESLFQQFPTTPGLHYLYGHLLFATDPDAGLAEFRRELEVSPKNPSALTMTAWTLLMQRHPAEALPYARRAAEQIPQSPAAQLILGRALTATGDLTGGIERLQQALGMDPNDLEIHIALAEAYSESGHKQDAYRERMLCLQLAQHAASQVATP
jgi:tetratricopeptide (TPR) repeat protein